jgi:hypothetical protein
MIERAAPGQVSLTVREQYKDCRSIRADTDLFLRPKDAIRELVGQKWMFG